MQAKKPEKSVAENRAHPLSTTNVLKTLEIVRPMVTKGPTKPAELVKAVQKKMPNMSRQTVSYQLRRLVEIGDFKELSEGRLALPWWEDWDDLIRQVLKESPGPYVLVEDVARKLASKLNVSPEDRGLINRIWLLALRASSEDPRIRFRHVFRDRGELKEVFPHGYPTISIQV